MGQVVLSILSSSRYVLLGFGLSALVTSLVTRLHPLHFWTGVASIIAWAALEVLKLSRRPKPNQL